MKKILVSLAAFAVVLFGALAVSYAVGERTTKVTGVSAKKYCIGRTSTKCPGRGCIILRVQNGETGWTTPGKKYCTCGPFVGGGCLAGVSRNGHIHLVPDAAVTQAYLAGGKQTFCH